MDQYGMGGGGENRSSGKVSERQSSFDGGLPFPAPGNVDHINRPKSMMMLMLRLIIEKLTPHLVTATRRHLIRRRRSKVEEDQRIDSPPRVAFFCVIHHLCHPSDEEKEESSSLLCVSVIATRWNSPPSPHLRIILSLKQGTAVYNS